MRIPLDKQDKLHGCLEHLFNQVCKALLSHKISFSLPMSTQENGNTELDTVIVF